MKVIQESQREVYDFTCEEIKDISCPMCLAKVEYTEREIEAQQKYEPCYGMCWTCYVRCPCCKSEIGL